MNYGVIDVGSNSVRLLFNGKKQVINTQLSEKNVPGGALLETAINRTADAVFTLADFVENEGGTVKIFATEAVRSASNGRAFIDVLKNRGLVVDVLSPETEARIGFDGAYDGTGTKAVLDVGGASSELIVGSSDGIVYSHSLPLGSVRTKDLGVLPPKLNVLVAQRVKEYGIVPTFDSIVSIGGTSSSLVAIRDKVEPYDGEKIHLKKLSLYEIERIVEFLYATPIEERAKIPGLHPKKILVIPAGGVLIAEIMKYLGTEEITVSENDNLEGYLARLEK